MRKTSETYTKSLRKLEKLLRNKGPLTAKQISKQMRCSVVSVYRQIAALDQDVREHYDMKTKGTGPKPIGFSI